MTEKTSVIVVDDSKDFCMLMEEYLGDQKGIEVVGVAYNGLDAVEIIKDKEPDILILDMVMPHLDGLGVMEEMEKLNITETNTIVLSAIGREEIIQRMANLGASYYLMKPVDLDNLMIRIRELMN